MRKWTLIVAYARRRWHLFIWALPLAVISGGLAVLQPWPMRLLVDNVLGNSGLSPVLQKGMDMISVEGRRNDLLTFIAIAGLVLFFSTRTIGALLAWISIKGSWHTAYSVAEDVFCRLQQRSLAFHKTIPVGELMGRVLNDSRSARDVLENVLFAPAVAVVMLTGMLILMARVNLMLALIAFAAAPFSWAITALMSGRLRTAARLNRELEGQIQSQVQQTFSGIGVVQAFAQEDHEQNRFQSLAERHVRLQKNNLLLGRVNNLGVGTVSVLTSGLVLWLVARSVLVGGMSLGSGLMFLAYFGTLQAQLGVLRDLSSVVHVVGESATRVATVLDTPPEITDRSGATPLVNVRGEIEFRDVTAGYGTKEVLKNISLRIEPGQTVALIGPTGSGKTTLANLIVRFDDPRAGVVSIDGRDVRDVELTSLRQHIAIVMQEPFLLPMSVAENIAYGRPSATLAEIERAARAAQAHGFITDLPKGYDTVIGERGATLSGGMRQRISIARALVKNAPILILDEPSSSMDAETEQLIIETLHLHSKERTTLVIAHRLSTIREADLIVVLKDGGIAEMGRHAELQAKSGYYARMQALRNQVT